MTTITPPLHELCLLPTGRIRMDLDPSGVGLEDWVYQRRGKGKGNIDRLGRHDLQLRRKGVRHDRLTSKNETRRAIFAAAVAAWRELDESERIAYRERAEKLPITGYNLFIREHQDNTMATLDQRITELATAIGTAIKSITDNIGTMANLATTEKTTLVGSINEINSALAGAVINDHDYVQDFTDALNGTP